jgi:hypothetical protein
MGNGNNLLKNIQIIKSAQRGYKFSSSSKNVQVIIDRENEKEEEHLSDDG